MHHKKYKNNFKEYSENGNIDLDVNTNAITFINKGTSLVTINDTYPVTAGGGSLSIGGNEGEVDFTLYKASFATGGENKLIVISKQYI